ncbi:hypothetical protein LAV79_14955 [Peribacillus butanolivorans]|uniref:hypothetical protein n=1 Tax=Peribacillus butanolivorans TaxID=421767 RepID=UPI0030C8FBC2
MARTNIIVQKGGKLDILQEDGENFKQNLFAPEMSDLILTDYTATKLTIRTGCNGHGTPNSLLTRGGNITGKLAAMLCKIYWVKVKGSA